MRYMKTRRGHSPVQDLNLGSELQGARIECTLSKFADHTTVRGSGSFTGGQVTIQKDIDRLEKESSRNLMRFSTAEYRALALVREDILLPSRFGINWLKSNFMKKDLRTPVDNRGNVSQ
ncbi:rna-directed dna polymerase from mobile element jockey-like [Limosa lapponica baueri]|uniref:Rna-directed dna polymerase from mobile element jockey-like n=1 Tax=Limosa lapponica baueri TaxID=1758121 RepID=A0A2I0ULL9_LIMLA|nr:rna-directed dna polymerase from mobile element jockey-like [Limosa lapponica baueri]